MPILSALLFGDYKRLFGAILRGEISPDAARAIVSHKQKSSKNKTRKRKGKKNGQRAAYQKAT